MLLSKENECDLEFLKDVVCGLPYVEGTTVSDIDEPGIPNFVSMSFYDETKQ